MAIYTQKQTFSKLSDVAVPHPPLRGTFSPGEGILGALNILFFVISSAELELQVLIQPVTLILGVIYIIARSCGKYYGAMFSCALTAATLPDGALARKVVLFAVLIYELAGSALTKRSLLAVGEIKQEDRISARKVNEEK